MPESFKRPLSLAAMIFVLSCWLLAIVQPPDQVLAQELPIQVSIPVEVVTAQENDFPQGGVYFELETLEQNPAAVPILVGVSQTGLIGPLSFDQTGTYRYHLIARPQDPANSSIEGNTSFLVQVIVEPAEDGLAAAVIASKWTDGWSGRGSKETITIELNPITPSSSQNNNPSDTSGNTGQNAQPSQKTEYGSTQPAPPKPAAPAKTARLTDTGFWSTLLIAGAAGGWFCVKKSRPRQKSQSKLGSADRPD